MNPDKAKQIAEETLDAIKNGQYKTASGKIIFLNGLVSPAVKHSRLYKPNWNPILLDQPKTPEIIVTKESTLEAAERLVNDSPCILNFASAKNPGGGFLRGSLAQEESIARSSALYHTLIEHPEYYEENKNSQRKNIGLYLNYAIYSPYVPIFRNDNGDWLETPYTTSIVTSPAPNKGAIIIQGDMLSDTETDVLEEEISRVFLARMIQVLSIMADNEHSTIVLGAWGCGIFGNDPWIVSKLFREALNKVPYFSKVVFAIYDRKESDVFKAFEREFGTC